MGSSPPPSSRTKTGPEGPRPLVWVLRVLGGLVLLGAVGFGVLYLDFRANEDEIDSEVYLGRGTWAYHRENYTEALALFDQAIALDPQNIAAYFGRGQAYLELQQYERAAADFTQVINAGLDQFEEAYHERGMAHLGLEDYPAAIADFDRALSINPHYGASYYGRAMAHEALGQTAAALADYERFMNTYFVEDALRQQAQARLTALGGTP